MASAETHRAALAMAQALDVLLDRLQDTGAVVNSAVTVTWRRLPCGHLWPTVEVDPAECRACGRDELYADELEDGAIARAIARAAG